MDFLRPPYTSPGCGAQHYFCCLPAGFSVLRGFENVEMWQAFGVGNPTNHDWSQVADGFSASLAFHHILSLYTLITLPCPSKLYVSRNSVCLICTF